MVVNYLKKVFPPILAPADKLPVQKLQASLTKSLATTHATLVNKNSTLFCNREPSSFIRNLLDMKPSCTRHRN